MKVFYLTQNPNLVSTTRSLQGWLRYGREAGVESQVAVSAEGDFAGWLRDENIEHRVTPMPWPGRSNLIGSTRHAAQLAWWARRNGVDLLHLNEHNVHPFAILIARLSGLPLVCHVRCKVTEGFTDWTFGKREPEALIWCSPQMHEECGPITTRTVRESRQHVIPLGLDLREFGAAGEARADVRAGWNVSDQEVVVGMAAAIRPGKRIEDFLKIAESFADKPECRFVLAGGCVPGDEDYYQSMLPSLKQANESGVIQWLGHLEPIEPFLHGIDVFVSTSEHESFGMSVCEAMACRKPVAAYSACSVEYVVGDAGLVVETGHWQGLRDAVGTLIESQSRRDDLGQSGRGRVESELNAQATFNSIHGLYRRVLETSQS